jgi:hypothetical protein
MNENGIFSESEYLDLIDLFFEISQSMSGKIAQDGRFVDIQILALKIFVHSTSSYWLYQGTNSPVPKTTNGSHYVDFASISVLTRVVIETYLTFWEVFISPHNEDEFEFNYCLWHLSGYSYKKDLKPTNGDALEGFQIAQDNIKSLCERIGETQKFKLLPTEHSKQRILKGIRKRDWKLIENEAGISRQFIDVIYGYTSGYTHADGSTSQQLYSSYEISSQQELSHFFLTINMIFISKFILDYVKLNPEVQNILPNYSKTFHEVLSWCEIAKNLQWQTPLNNSI